MKHGSLHTHSTLLNSTGNVERYRVRSEIQDFVKDDTKRLQIELKHNNKEFRKNIRKEQHHLLGLYEENKKAQLGRWRLRTANSPLRLDQNEIHRHLMDEWKQHFRAEKKHNLIKQELKKMTGKPVFDICSDKYLRSIADPEQKLAMERRKLLLELKVVKKEKTILQSMVDRSMGDCERMFPKVAMQIAHGHSTTGMSVNSSMLRAPKVSAEDAARIKNEDNRVYSAAGRYDEFGRFILTDDLKTKAGMVSAEYAQVTGKGGVTTEYQSVNSYSPNNMNASRQGSLSSGGFDSPTSRRGGSSSVTSGNGSLNSSSRKKLTGADSAGGISPHGSNLQQQQQQVEGEVDIGTRSLDSMTLSSNDEPSLTLPLLNSEV